MEGKVITSIAATSFANLGQNSLPNSIFSRGNAEQVTGLLYPISIMNRPKCGSGSLEPEVSCPSKTPSPTVESKDMALLSCVQII